MSHMLPLEPSDFTISRSQLKVGEAALSHYASLKWNTLPPDITCAPTLNAFKRQLKHICSVFHFNRPSLDCVQLSFVLNILKISLD